MVRSWVSSIGRRIGDRPRPNDPRGVGEFPPDQAAAAAASERTKGDVVGRFRPGLGAGGPMPISDAIRAAFAERKREALEIAGQAAAEIADCPTCRAVVAIAKVAETAHQLAGTAAYFDEAKLGDVAAAVDYRLRIASVDDRLAIAEAIAELQAALSETAIPVAASHSVHPVSRTQTG